MISELLTLLQCPAVRRVGVLLIREIVDAIDEGREEEAARLARDAARRRREGEAVGMAAARASAVTTARMRGSK